MPSSAIADTIRGMPEGPDEPPLTIAAFVASNVRGERNRKRPRAWTQAQLAERIRELQPDGARQLWSTAMVGDLETGRRAVLAEDLPLLCGALGISLADLVRGADPDEVARLRLGRT